MSVACQRGKALKVWATRLTYVDPSRVPVMSQSHQIWNKICQRLNQHIPQNIENKKTITNIILKVDFKKCPPCLEMEAFFMDLSTFKIFGCGAAPSATSLVAPISATRHRSDRNRRSCPGFREGKGQYLWNALWMMNYVYIIIYIYIYVCVQETSGIWRMLMTYRLHLALECDRLLVCKCMRLYIYIWHTKPEIE